SSRRAQRKPPGGPALRNPRPCVSASWHSLAHAPPYQAHSSSRSPGRETRYVIPTSPLYRLSLVKEQNNALVSVRDAVYNQTSSSWFEAHGWQTCVSERGAS